MMGRQKADLAPMLLAALIVTTFSLSLFGGFVRDDWTMIVENDGNMRSIAVIPHFFTSGVWTFSSRGQEGTDLYRPIWLVWHFLNHRISGHNPFGWHVASFALHTVNAFLVAALIRRLLPETTVAEQYAGAALFAVLTVVETFTWRSEEAWLKTIIAHDPGATGAWVFLARNHVRLGDATTAIEVYREAIETVPRVSDKVVIAEMLGLHYADAGAFQESLEVYQWVSRQPGFEAAGLVGAGNSYWMMNRRQMALDAYLGALEADPTNAFARFNAARLLESLGRREEAVAQYMRLLKHRPPGATAEMLEHARRFMSRKGDVVPRLVVPR